ncbi:hypothetical protein QO034_02565 [Sedimentitalea sp. JM2-8]|uniref:Protein translocase subunit SecA n=1 Tax=Sedimentitalea xiamensis TaxID=3050037 RepID=A0ABT7FA41_9RHOB|nr:DEAD/DEAH box helicase [Sedimentitalea xiamensis]MDK3071983.1 hypothetical protein [Sedimentitalea xiamensis]
MSSTPMVAGFAPPQVRFYPERADRDAHWLDELGETALRALAQPALAAVAPVRFRFDLRRIHRQARNLTDLNDADFDAEILRARVALRRDVLSSRSLWRGIALARETTFRELGLRHRDVQIRGALAMLRGALIEMDTGEGKTITAALAAATAALAGIPTHVITVNNYLAERDAENLGPIYERLGLRTGVILEDMSPEDRRQVYRSDIVYASNTEIAFDYLRDRITFGREGPRGTRAKLRRVTQPAASDNPVMRGLSYAIVDEADSVLVDEARTPLIISRRSDPEAEAAWTSVALDIARSLERGKDFIVIGDERRLKLTDAGRDSIGRLAAGRPGIWESPIRREEVTSQALSVLYIFKNGEHYLVNDGKVQIIDEYTGRLQPDRSWSDGLHQLVEAKEKVEITGQNLVMARMTYQRFFRRYLRLAGMTGTAREVSGELQSVFGLHTVRIPPHKKSRLRFRRTRIFRTTARKWRFVVRETQREIALGRPVLIGTRSVAASREVSTALEAAGIAHEVLNAETVAESSRIIAQAGGAGRVTVATNMAGRGVDIALDEKVVGAGGLHVILTERHDAGRIDRQLAGRCARRGEPGSVSTVLSMEDALLDVIEAPVAKAVARVPYISVWVRLRLFDRAQKRAEKVHARARKDLVRQDRRLNQLLSFAGGME